MPYEVCRDEDDNSANCTAAIDLATPWAFSRGTVTVDYDFAGGYDIGLRLDDIYLREGLNCATDIGAAADCHCWDTDGGNAECADNTECSGTDNCGPNSEEITFTVRLYQQDFVDGDLITGCEGGSDFIGRKTSGPGCGPKCYLESVFSVRDVSASRNKQVNSVVSDGAFCGQTTGSVSAGSEIRHIEVVDSEGNIVAVATSSFLDQPAPPN